MSASIGFVCVVEQGDLERKVVLLAESLRKFGGTLRNAPIWAVQPRKGYGVSQLTLDRFADLQVWYVFADVNQRWKEYGFANKHYAAALIESAAGTEVQTLCFLDSDAIFVNPPTALILPEDQDIAVRPVHIHRGNGSGWEVEEPTNPFWEFLLDIAGTDRSRLWQIETQVDQRKLWTYFQGGLVAVKPEKKIFQTIVRHFERLQDDRRLWERCTQHYWYLEQSLLTATIVAETPRERILILDDIYNYPINWHTEIPQAQRKASLEQLVHIHYHDAFYHLNWLEQIRMNPSLRRWLEERLPLSREHSAPAIRDMLTYYNVSSKELLLQLGRKGKHALLQYGRRHSAYL